MTLQFAGISSIVPVYAALYRVLFLKTKEINIVNVVGIWLRYS